MPNDHDITTRFKVDVSELKQGIAEANKNIKLANAEFKAASAGMDDWAKSSDGINAKLKQLGSVLTEQNKKLESYKKQQEAVDNACAENGRRAEELKQKLTQLASQGVAKTSAEYQKYQKALNEVEKEQQSNKTASDNLRVTILNQQAAVNKTEKEMRGYEDSLGEVAKAEKEAAKHGTTVEEELKKAGKSADDSSGGFTVLKGALSNLVANAMSTAIEKLGELASSLFELVEATEEYRSMQSKLVGATNTYGYELEYTTSKFEEFYKYLGDSQMANNAISNLLGLQVETGTLDSLVNGAISAWTMYGDSIPIESLTESINETIQVGQVTGTFADALNWTKINQDELAASLGNGSAAQQAFNAAIANGESVEDAFSAALSATSDQSERANIVAQFLNDTYGESKTTYDEMNGAMLDANEAELALVDTQSELAEVVSPVKDAFTQLKTAALDLIAPLIADIAQKFLDLKTYLEENPEAMAAVTAAAAALGAAFVVLALALGIEALINGVTKAIAFLNTTMLANPAVLIVAAIAALVAGFIVLWNKSDAFREFWIGLWEKIKAAAQSVIDFVVNLFTQAWDLIKAVWDFVSPYFEALWFTIKTIFAVVKDVLSGNFSDAWEKIKSIFATWKDFFSGLWAGVKSIFSGVVNFFKSIFNGAWNAVKNVFNGFVSFFSGLWDKIKNTFSSLGAKIGDAIGGAVKSGINGVISLIENTINSAIGLINGAIGLINKIPGVSVNEVSKVSLPRLAKGGVLKKGQVGLLEGDGAEAVVPLEKNKFWIGKVADELKGQLLGLNNGSLSSAANAVNNSKVNNFTQIINAPKQPSRIELYRQTKNLLALSRGH